MWKRLDRTVILIIAVFLIIFTAIYHATVPLLSPALPPPSVGVIENIERETLGEMEVEYTPRMRPGASNTFALTILIPETLADEVPDRIVFFDFVENDISDLGLRYTDVAVLYISHQMRAELIAPAFEIGGPASVTQAVNITEPNKPTFWTWTLVAPQDEGLHDVTLKVYQILGPDNEVLALPPRIYQIEAAAPTPTPLPTPVPFIQTEAGTTTTIGCLAIIIVAALLSLPGLLAAKDRLTPLTKGGKVKSLQRRLARHQANLNTLLEQKAVYAAGDEPLDLLNKIAEERQTIEELQAELAALEGA